MYTGSVKTVYHFPGGEPSQVEGLCLSFLLHRHTQWTWQSSNPADRSLLQTEQREKTCYHRWGRVQGKDCSTECGASDCRGRGNRTQHTHHAAKHTLTSYREWGHSEVGMAGSWRETALLLHFSFQNKNLNFAERNKWKTWCASKLSFLTSSPCEVPYSPWDQRVVSCCSLYECVGPSTSLQEYVVLLSWGPGMMLVL